MPWPSCPICGHTPSSLRGPCARCQSPLPVPLVVALLDADDRLHHIAVAWSYAMPLGGMIQMIVYLHCDPFVPLEDVAYRIGDCTLTAEATVADIVARLPPTAWAEGATPVITIIKPDGHPYKAGRWRLSADSPLAGPSPSVLKPPLRPQTSAPKPGLPETETQTRPPPVDRFTKHQTSTHQTASQPPPHRQRPPQIAVSHDTIQRRATVAAYSRVNPQRLYPLSVSFAAARLTAPDPHSGIQLVVAESPLVVSARTPHVVVRPILPGCDVYPQQLTVDLRPAIATARFQIAPRVLGPLPEARIEIDLPQAAAPQILPLVIVVAETRWTRLAAASAFVWPALSAVLQSTPQTDSAPGDFLRGVLVAATSWPWATEIGLAIIAVAWLVFYLASRPRQSTFDADLAFPLAVMSGPDLVAAADAALAAKQYPQAVSLLADAVNLAPHDTALADRLAAARASLAHPSNP